MLSASASVPFFRLSCAVGRARPCAAAEGAEGTEVKGYPQGHGQQWWAPGLAHSLQHPGEKGVFGKEVQLLE